MSAIDWTSILKSGIRPEIEAVLGGVDLLDGPAIGRKKPYVSYGPSDSLDDDAEGIEAAEVTLQIDVWSSGLTGATEAETIAAAVRGAIHNSAVTLSGAHLIDLSVVRMRILTDSDALTAHAVLIVRALMDAD